MTIKPVKDIKKKRSVKQQIVAKEAESQDEQFPDDFNDADGEIEPDNRLNDVVYPYHIIPKRSSLKKNTTVIKTSGGNSPRPHVGHKGNDDILKSVDQASSQAASVANETQEECSGYNSGDEHSPAVQEVIDWKKRDEDFEKLLQRKGLILKAVAEDGACLFRAISTQIYGDENMHDIVRQMTMDHIQKNCDYFSAFMTENIDDYIKRKRDVKAHGNHIELQAISEVYNRPIELYAYETKPINIFNSDQLKNGYPPLRLSYQRNNHYNAITDPYDASVGIGLGLPGLKPNLQTTEAIKISEQLEIEKTMLEDKIKTADWEATNEAIEEQIARESYLEWLQQTLKKNKKTENAVTATITSYSQVKPTTICSASKDSSGNIHQSTEVKPSTSQGKLINDSKETNSSNPDLKDGNENSFDTAALKYKTNSMEEVVNDFEAKRVCSFDLRNSDEENQTLPNANAAPVAKLEDKDDHLPSTSKQSSPANSGAKAPPASANASPQKTNPSNLYEELLQASLAFGDYNESEMFQRVLQMSTEDYLLQQNRNNSSYM